MKSARVDRNQATLRPYYEKYGLDVDLWIRPNVPNVPVIEEQVERLFALFEAERSAFTGCPPLVIKHRATELLGCFATQIDGAASAVAVPSSLAQLLGRLMDVQNDIRGGAKQPNALEAAREYTKANPDASQNAVAKEVGVTSTAVSNWYTQGKLPDWNGPRK